jgi:DNA-binding CsgD family transcriptional regulator
VSGYVDSFSDWNAVVADAVGALREPEFSQTLQRLLSALVPYDIFMVFAYFGRAQPICLAHNMDTERAEIVIHAYTRGPYLLDPFYSVATGPERAGMLQLKMLAPDHFYSSEYFKQHYERTEIRDEVGYLARPDGATGVVLSFTRPLNQAAFSARDLARVRSAEPLIRRLIEVHWSDVGERFPTGQEDHLSPIDVALDEMATGRLTRREIEITALILRGHSNSSIAELLAISAGTVKIHRRNVYQKLEVSSQADLFSRFIAHLAR